MNEYGSGVETIVGVTCRRARESSNGDGALKEVLFVFRLVSTNQVRFLTVMFSLSARLTTQLQFGDNLFVKFVCFKIVIEAEAEHSTLILGSVHGNLRKSDKSSYLARERVEKWLVKLVIKATIVDLMHPYHSFVSC